MNLLEIPFNIGNVAHLNKKGYVKQKKTVINMWAAENPVYLSEIEMSS